MRLRACASLLLFLAGCSSTPSYHGYEVWLRGHVALRYEAAWDPARHDDTDKVFHHVFAPDGELLTKGTGGEFPHHRGLFVAFNRVTANGKTWDFWHCGKGESQRHLAFVEPRTLGLAGDDWRASRIAWLAGDGTVVAEELRALRVSDGGSETTVIDLVSELRAVAGPLRLAADPQHSGCQFRALQAFAPEGAPKVRYLLGPGSKAEGDDVYSGCDWVAAILPMPSGPVTVLHIDAATNPRPNRYSARPYGRFGSTFTAELQPDRPLRLSYRLVVALGEMNARWCALQAAKLTAP